MQGTAQTSMQGAAQTNMQGTAQTSMQGAAQTSTPPAARTSTPPAAQTFTPPAAQTFTPPAAQTCTPPAAQTCTPPAAQTSTPPAAQTSTPPATQTSTSPATQTSTSPAAQTSTSPAAQTSTSPAAQTSGPPIAQTSGPPVAQTSGPPVTQTSEPPVAQTTGPPHAQTSGPPAAQAVVQPTQTAPNIYTLPPNFKMPKPILHPVHLSRLMGKKRLKLKIRQRRLKNKRNKFNKASKLRAQTLGSNQPGMPRSFNVQPEMSLEASGSPIFIDAPIWSNNPMMDPAYPNDIILGQQPPDIYMNPATSPILVQTENFVDVQQSFPPSNIYSDFGTNSVTVDSPIWPSNHMMNPVFPNAIMLDQQLSDNYMNPDTFVQTENPFDVQQPYLPSYIYSDLGTNPVTNDSTIWPNNPMMNAAFPHPIILGQQPPGNHMNPTTSLISVQTENTVNVQQPYLSSYIYSNLETNLEPPEVDAKSSEHFGARNQSEQKRLSAFQRLAPITQPKKPKFTINLNLKKDRPVSCGSPLPEVDAKSAEHFRARNQSEQKRLSAVQRLAPITQPKKPKFSINLNLKKDQPVREKVNETDGDPNKYTPVHLRKDIMRSKDETVMRYLPAWPWRKNIAIERSVTARNSRSVMILEQEKMEEAYEKENIYIQISVKGYPSTWTKERVLDAVLDSVKGYSLIPCFTEFTQNECKFLVLRSRSALIVLHKTGFYIHKDGVELAITISLPILPDKLNFIPKIILRKRIIMGLMDKKVNLSAFTLQDDISHFIYFPLNRVTNQKDVILRQTSIDWNCLVELDLSHNRLTTISGFDLINVTPRLKHLNLSHNCLEKITVLLHYRLLPLKTIHLEGNPLCHDYIDPEHYVKVIRMMFPAVVEIDGVPIHRKGELPVFKQNYCPEEAQEVAEKFLEIFFPLLDSGPDHRSLIQGMYKDDATLTVTYHYNLRFGTIYRNFKNLFLYARFLDEGETDAVVGAMSITKLINRWPHTEHDPFTFTVDVLSHIETTTILRVSGVLKLTADTLAEDEHLLSFTRTVVLYSKDGAEYKIHNEMVYWSAPTAAAARSAFRVNTISQKNFNLKIEATTDQDLRDKFLKIFMKLTSMNKKISERCLEINNWNLKLALECFTRYDFT